MRRENFSPWILGAALLSVAIIVLLWLQSERNEAKATLVDEMNLATRQIAELDLETLQVRLSERRADYRTAQVQLDEETGVLVSRNESADVCDSLFTIAERCSVQILKLTSPGVVESLVDDEKTLVLAISLEVTGEVVDTLRFVSQVHEAYPFGHVTAVKLDNPDGEVQSASPGAIQGGDEPTTTKVTLMITQYREDEDDG
jgi:hypothetical protein